MVKCNKKSEDFQLRKRLPDESFPIMTNDKCKINFKLNKKHLLQNVRSLLLRVNNLNIMRKKTSFVRFQVKQGNLFGLALIDTGNLVHSAIVSGEFWVAIGGKISNSMNYKVGTAEC